MAQLYVEIGAKVGDFQKALSRIERRVNRFSRNMERLGTNLTQAVTVPLLGLGTGAVAAAAKFEKLRTSLGVLLGDAERGNELFKELQQFAARTPFSLDQIASGTKQLLAFGFSVEQSRDALQFLGDIAAATGSNLTDLTLIVGQARAIGAAYTQDLRQLANRGIPVFDLLSEKTGLTGESLKKFVEDGGVSFELLQEILKDTTREGNLFFGGLEAQSQTLSGVFSTFKDNVQLALGELGEAISESVNLKGVLSDLTGFIQRLTDGFKALTPETQAFIVKAGLVVAAIGPVLLIIGKLSSIIPVLILGVKNVASVVGLLAAAVNFLLSPVGLAVAAIVGLGAAIIIAYNRSEVFRRGINAIINVVLELGRIVGDVVTNIIEGFQAIGQRDFKGALTNFTEALTNINPIAGLAEGQGGRLGRAFLEGFGDESNRITDGLETLKDKIFRATEGIVPNLQQSGAGLAAGSIATPVSTGGGAGGDVEKIDDSLISAERRIGRIVANAELPRLFQDTAAAATDWAEATRPTLQAIENFNPNPLQSLLDFYKPEEIEKLQEQLSSVANITSGVLTEGFQGFFNTIAEGGANVFDGFISAIKRLVVQLATAVAAAAALALIFTLISGGIAGGGAAGLSGVKALLGFSEGSLFKNFFRFPGLAEGGIVPPGYPNDSYFARLSSGEAVIPLSKLNQFSGGATEVTGEFRISGNDLVAAVVRNQQNRERTRGR